MSLYVMKNRAYSVYCSEAPQSQENWDELKRTESPQFKYLSTIMGRELLLCRFIGSLREKDFLLYVKVCDDLALSMF